MANSWVYISCYMLIIVPLLLCGASLNYSANPLTNSYALDTPSKFSISNLQQTQQVCIQNYVQLNADQRNISCPSGSTIQALDGYAIIPGNQSTNSFVDGITYCPSVTTDMTDSFWYCTKNYLN